MKEQHDILTGMLNCTEAASILYRGCINFVSNDDITDR